jgi:hypothetical protein
MEAKQDKWPFNGHRVDMQHSAERRTAQELRIAAIEAAAGEVAININAGAVVVDIEQFEFRPEDN